MTRLRGAGGCSCLLGTQGLGRAAWRMRPRNAPATAGSRWRGGGAGRPVGLRCTGRGCSRCGHASAAELGDEDGARSVFDALAAGRFAVIPVNNDMLLSLGRLAEVAWFLRDADRGAVLHGLLLPYRGLVVD